MSNFLESLQPYLTILGDTPMLQALVLLLASTLFAFLIDWLLVKVVRRLTSRTRTNLDDKILDILHQPIFYSILMIGLGSALLIMNLTATTENLLLALVKTVAVLVWTIFIIRLARVLLRRMSSHPDHFALVRLQTLPLFENLAFIIAIAAALYLIFSAWDVDMTAWLASAGIVGIAVGFAAKDTLANLFSGVFILADAPYKIGDFVVLESGERGAVTHIGIRSTRLLTRDDVEVTIPNSIMGNTKIINESGGPYEKSRIRVQVTVAYDTDIQALNSALLQVADQQEAVCKTPEPRVRFRRFGLSGLDYELLCWIDQPVLRGRTLDALNTDVLLRFRELNIEIPYNKQDIYIKEVPGDQASP